MYFDENDEKHGPVNCNYRTEKDEKEARERQLAEEKRLCNLARSRELAWEARLKSAKCRWQ